MAITGEIDLTQGLDFFRHKELPSIIPRVLPWVKEKEKTGRPSIPAHTGIRVNYNINTISNSTYIFIGNFIPNSIEYKRALNISHNLNILRALYSYYASLSFN